jgi:hypothetical protein
MAGTPNLAFLFLGYIRKCFENEYSRTMQRENGEGHIESHAYSFPNEMLTLLISLPHKISKCLPNPL